MPFLESETKAANELLRIDIEALASLLDLLMACYEKTGKHKQFPDALNALYNAISLTGWYDKIAYQRALWQLLDSDDNRLVFHELKKISDINSTDNVEILTLYLHSYQGRLPFSEKIGTIDRGGWVCLDRQKRIISDTLSAHAATCLQGSILQ